MTLSLPCSYLLSSNAPWLASQAYWVKALFEEFGRIKLSHLRARRPESFSHLTLHLSSSLCTIRCDRPTFHIDTMATKTVFFSPEEPFQLGVPHLFGAALLFLALLWHWAQDERPFPGFPVINKEKGEWLNTKAKNRMINSANKLMKEAHEKVSTMMHPCYLPALPHAVWAETEPQFLIYSKPVILGIILGMVINQIHSTMANHTR